MSAKRGWYPDPLDRERHRYWNGRRWLDGTKDKDGLSVAAKLADGQTGRGSNGLPPPLAFERMREIDFSTSRRTDRIDRGDGKSTITEPVSLGDVAKGFVFGFLWATVISAGVAMVASSTGTAIDLGELGALQLALWVLIGWRIKRRESRPIGLLRPNRWL